MFSVYPHIPSVPLLRDAEFFKYPGVTCHAERSEASFPVSCQTLRFAQGDMVPGWNDEEDLLPLRFASSRLCVTRTYRLRQRRNDAKPRNATA